MKLTLILLGLLPSLVFAQGIERVANTPAGSDGGSAAAIQAMQARLNQMQRENAIFRDALASQMAAVQQMLGFSSTIALSGSTVISTTNASGTAIISSTVINSTSLVQALLPTCRVSESLVMGPNKTILCQPAAAAGGEIRRCVGTDTTTPGCRPGDGIPLACIGSGPAGNGTYYYDGDGIGVNPWAPNIGYWFGYAGWGSSHGATNWGGWGHWRCTHVLILQYRH